MVERAKSIEKSTKPIEAEPQTEKKSITSNNNNSSSQEEYSYFYQSTDGQRIYINALNSRCLVNEYSLFSQCPSVIKGKIVAYDSFFMSEENRKRYKYLSHLPLHSEFKIVELELKEPYLSKKTLELFSDEIDERRRMRERKEIREKRIADRLAAANSDPHHHPHYYVASAMNEISMRTNSLSENVLDYSNEFPEASSSPPNSSSGVSSISSGSANTNNLVDQANSSQQQVSFAQMLRHPSGDSAGKKSALQASAWPTLESTSTASSANTNPLTNGWLNMVKQQQQQQPVLGRSKKYQNAPAPWVASSATSGSLEAGKSGDSFEDSESMPAPLYKESFFSAIDETLKMIESSNYSFIFCF